MLHTISAHVHPLASRFTNKITDSEELLWYHLSENQLGSYSFQRHHAIGSFVANFYCGKAKLAIKIDGQQYRPEHAINKPVETDALDTAGIKVLRFTYDEITHHTQSVVNEIKRYLLFNSL